MMNQDLTRSLKEVIRGVVNVFSITFESLSTQGNPILCTTLKDKTIMKPKDIDLVEMVFPSTKTHNQPKTHRFPRAYFEGTRKSFAPTFNKNYCKYDFLGLAGAVTVCGEDAAQANDMGLIQICTENTPK